MFLAASTVCLAGFFGISVADQKSLNPALRPSLDGATSWLNSQRLELQGLRGKVVLVDFWTYTCINWRRTLPYVREWAAKYKKHGLIVIGVHTPEFSFEKNRDNVTRETQNMSIPYPVAMDNNFAIWHSFQNQYWPALYLIDTKGRLRYQKFGEGDYEEIELMIQKLLKEASAENVFDKSIAPPAEGYEAAPDWQNLKSPETYIGYSRISGFTSPGGLVGDKLRNYSMPRRLKLNQWGFSGEWIMGQEQARLYKGSGKIIYRFHARDIHVVMGPSAPGTTIRFRVLVDGTTPGSAHGLDIDSSGYGIITGPSMYQLIRQQQPIVDREFQIEFLDPGVEIYNFTFG
jgi:thiol-disulfide isomerase/thioredoxin